MSSLDLPSFRSVIRQLEQLCQQGQTGKFHIVTSQNHKAMIVLERGRIRGVSYRIKRGLAALEGLMGVTAGSWRLEQTSNLPEPDLALPATREILRQLQSLQPEDPQDLLIAPETPAQLSPLAQHEVSALLTNHIGPIAAILVASVFAETSDPETALQRLASEIPDKLESLRFKADARAVLERYPV